MEQLSAVALLLGGSWGAGISLYLTTAGMGIAHRMGWITLPGNLETIAHPLVIGTAVLLYAVEFFADKIPYVDSMWDAIHTFIRPAGGIALGYMAMADVSPVIQLPVALLTGSIAMDAHLTKATARAAINTSPEPVSNIVASVGEDAGVLGALYLMSAHPVVLTILVIVFIIFSIWFLTTMFKFLKKVLTRQAGRKPEPLDPGTPTLTKA